VKPFYTSRRFQQVYRDLATVRRVNHAASRTKQLPEEDVGLRLTLDREVARARFAPADDAPRLRKTPKA